ncbi:FAD-dependent oxidoreductase [Actinophytocola oryzae]|uniref:Alpha-galactosidase-like protein n=1 Tax=Actinophytocola oryzae TaxID=502181 RepID=A0A4R7VZ98_9PSEU|nr:FAD-dependent oxidoreductase [Actinophytocola oryzae]TDV55392.1 alpha-galactosidase-like protein [Actinophytocola oryzae]
MDSEVSRRVLLVGAGVSALLSATGGTSAAAPGGLRYHHPVPRAPGEVRSDICVYGGTSAGVTAAVRAARHGRSVVLVAFGRHLGGLTSSGLGATDAGRADAIGGLSREFYRRVGAHYGSTESFAFEPHVAEAVFDAWVAEEGVGVHREHPLSTVDITGGRITALRTENGTVFRAGVYVDASYEGDLMAAAGVTNTVGREGNATYGETLNGAQFRTGHQFQRVIDPYRTPGDPASGLLPGVQPDAPGTPGQGDHRIQAFNFRVCLTKAADRRSFPRPPGYDPARYELLRRYLAAGVWDAMRLNTPMPNGKTDLNNNGAVSTDNIGRNYDWPAGDYATRERIFQDHVTYQQGMLYYLANDPAVPQAIRAEVSAWGLPADEFPETGGWPHELYIREGRRMVGDYVVTEHDCRGARVASDPVGLASYNMDSHNCARVVVNGAARNEGDVQVAPAGPYGISYRAIVPARGECANLVVPVALSASHIAFGSVRMEPVFMLLGHAAASAAHLALESGAAVQDVDYPALRRGLLADGMVLTWPPGSGPVTLDAPAAPAPGTPFPVTATVANREGVPVTNVSLALTLPTNWTATPGPRTTPTLGAGEAFAGNWMVTAALPPDLLARASLAATATYTVAGAEVRSTATRTVAVAEPVGAPLVTAKTTEAYFGQRGTRLAILAGGRDLWTGIDEYGAILRRAVTSTSAEMTLVSQDATDPNARAGIVFRNADGTGYVALVAKPGNGFLLLWDADRDGTLDSVARLEQPTTYPARLRLGKAGSRFTGAVSLGGGTTWRQVGAADVPSASATQDVGIVVCAHSTTLGRAVFDGLAMR